MLGMTEITTLHKEFAGMTAHLERIETLLAELVALARQW